MAHILVVDDTLETGKLLRHIFSRRGHLAQYLTGGAGAIDLLRNTRFDLLVLDVMMPEIDGYAVLGSIRRDPDPAVSAIPVVMYSAIGDRRHVGRARDMGADEWIIKCSPVALLIRRVEALVCAPPQAAANARGRAAPLQSHTPVPGAAAIAGSEHSG